jgi:hypothetical protein
MESLSNQFLSHRSIRDQQKPMIHKQLPMYVGSVSQSLCMEQSRQYTTNELAYHCMDLNLGQD